MNEAATLVFVLALAVQTGVGVAFPRRLMRGWFTRKLIARIPPRRLWVAPFGMLPRILLVRGVAIAINHIHSFYPLYFTFDAMIVAVCLDDYLLGDDDRNRRRKAAVHNAVKWLMELPRATPPETA